MSLTLEEFFKNDVKRRCEVLVDGVPCDYASEWDELWVDPLANAQRLSRHNQHESEGKRVLRLLSKAEAQLRGSAEP